jgi:thiol-disulfide isomerase/thioredoxin
MKRIVLLAVLATLGSGAMLVADDKPAKPDEVKSKRADEMKAIREAWTKLQQDWVKELQAAKPEERAEIQKKRPVPTEYVARAQKLVDADAKDAVALDALTFIIQNSFLLNPAAGGKALQQVAENHASNSKIAPIMGLAGRLAGADKFYRAVLAENSDHKLKASACYQLGNYLHQQASRDAGKAAAFDKEAEQLFERVEKEFADVELGRMNNGKVVMLADQAKKMLFEIRNLGIGKTAPEVVSHDLDDKDVNLSALKGKVVVLDFWATWCPPCRASIPHSRELVEKMKDKPFVFVSISSDAEKKTLTDFLEKEKMPWTHWWEGVKENSVGNTWNITGIPTVYVIDAKGVIRFKQVGFNPAEADKLDKEVEKLLEEIKK